MNDRDVPAALPAEPTRCAQCGTALATGQDREVTDDGTFCRPCFNNLTVQLRQALDEQGRDVNYAMALIGGLAGGTLGAAVWWGFTVATDIAFGLVAVVIGFAVGKGVVFLSGHKRHRNLQVMSVAISVLSFAYASYLVNRTFIHRAWEAEGMTGSLPLLPEPALFVQVVQAGFQVFDLLFLAIVVWQAWKLPEPVTLPAPQPA